MPSTTGTVSGSAQRWGPLWGARPADWALSEDQQTTTYEDALRRVDLRPGHLVLDIGCGVGAFLRMVADRGARAFGLDASPALLDVARERVPGGDLRVGDMEALPYDDDTFDLVVGHAVIHHVPDVELAFKEMLRVVKPGGRVVVCGEPTRYGDLVARRLSRATWWLTTRATTLPPLRDTWARPREELDESSRAAALEAVVDLHTFDPAALAATVERAGAVDVHTVTEELTAAWFGWPVRTFEAAVPSERLGYRWRMFAFRSWLALSRVDRALAHVVPASLFYYVSVSATKPRGPERA